MRKIILLTIFSHILLNSFAQLWTCDEQFNVDFENQLCPGQLIIDTVSNPTNVWQIGVPLKTVFKKAQSEPNAIVTDTTNSYASNDTSRFMIKRRASGLAWSMHASVEGYYYVNSDTLTDFGIIEFSFDNGRTWVDLMNDTVYSNLSCYWWNGGKIPPVLSGNSNRWEYFFLDVNGFGSQFDIDPHDTIIYRFTFISDSVQTNKDGLMFDDFWFDDWVEGIEVKNQIQTKIFPNPVRSELCLLFEDLTASEYNINIYNIKGVLIYSTILTAQTKLTIDISDYENGIYWLEVNDIRISKRSINKFVKIE